MKLETDRVARIVGNLLKEQESYKGKPRQDLSRMWTRYLSPFRFKLMVALIITFVWSVHPYAMALTARFLVDDVLKVGVGFDPADLPGQLALHRIYLFLLFGLWSVFVLSHWTRSWFILNIGQQIVYTFRRELHEKLQALHIGFFENFETGKIMSRLLDDVNVIRMWVTSEVLNVASHIIRLLLGMGIIVILNWKLALLVIATMPFYGYAYAKLRPAIRRTSIALRRLNSNLYSLSDERISGVQVVKAFSQEGRERSRFSRIMHNYIRLGMQVVMYRHGLAFLAGVLTALTNGLVIYLGLLQVKSGDLTLGDVIVFVYALPNLFAQVSALTVVATSVQAVLVVIKRVFNILDEDEQVAPGHIKLDGMDGRIYFDDVSFSYPGQDKPALQNVDFQIKPGMKIALMGPSGAGKSTVFQLLERFYDPQNGAVRVGGVNLQDADIHSIHSHIRMVQQEPAIFSGTIADNIRYGELDARPVRIMEAAKQAEFHDFVLSLPAKYETTVGQNGISLSGGQKQRLALATALLTRPEILLLDDTTSALDSETEARIRETLNRVLEGRTSLIITQRIATARDCDMIIVLEEGRITQMGIHNDLVHQEGFYKRIYDQQKSL